MMLSSQKPFYILLADDDEDDCFLFKEALDELDIKTQLSIVHNGEQLIKWLNNKELPHLLFMDLNMPRKNGMDCLIEIKGSENFNNLPIIIYSTSFQADVVDLLYKQGAQFYIRKPNKFLELKNVIHNALTLAAELKYKQPSKENFVLSTGLIIETL